MPVRRCLLTGTAGIVLRLTKYRRDFQGKRSSPVGDGQVVFISQMNRAYWCIALIPQTRIGLHFPECRVDRPKGAVFARERLAGDKFNGIVGLFMILSLFI